MWALTAKGGAAGGGPSAAPAPELRHGLDDDQRVSFGVAQPEHRRHRAAEARDLVVDIDAGGLQGGVVGVDVAAVEDDPGLFAAGL
jgi:hypothetical protein